MPTKASKSSSAVATPDGDPILATESGDIVGHGLIKSLLARMIEERRLPQAVLFAGPPLLGKRSMAVVLGKRLLGSGVAPPVAKKSRAKTGEAHPTAAPDPLLSDGAVSRRVVRSCHLDFAVVRPEGGSKVVRIEQVRSLQDWAWLSPAEGPAKVVLIFGADTITEEAANSLLKLLEEPPPKLTLILISDFPHRLLETVRSRCTLFAFHPLPMREVETWLHERHGVETDRARLIAGLAEGRPGLALQFLQEDALVVRAPMLEELRILRENGFLALPGVAARSLRHAGGLRAALDGILVLIRDAMVLSGDSVAEGALLGIDLRDKVGAVFAGLSRGALLGAAESVARGMDLTRHLYIPSEALVLENVLADVGMALRKSG